MRDTLADTLEFDGVDDALVDRQRQQAGPLVEGRGDVRERVAVIVIALFDVLGDV